MSRLLELSKRLNYQRTKPSRHANGRPCGDTSQHGNWSCFRNAMYGAINTQTVEWPRWIALLIIFFVLLCFVGSFCGQEFVIDPKMFMPMPKVNVLYDTKRLSRDFTYCCVYTTLYCIYCVVFYCIYCVVLYCIYCILLYFLCCGRLGKWSLISLDVTDRESCCSDTKTRLSPCGATSRVCG